MGEVETADSESPAEGGVSGDLGVVEGLQPAEELPELMAVEEERLLWVIVRALQLMERFPELSDGGCRERLIVINALAEDRLRDHGANQVAELPIGSVVLTEQQILHRWCSRWSDRCSRLDGHRSIWLSTAERAVGLLGHPVIAPLQRAATTVMGVERSFEGTHGVVTEFSTVASPPQAGHDKALSSSQNTFRHPAAAHWYWRCRLGGDRVPLGGDAIWRGQQFEGSTVSRWGATDAWNASTSSPLSMGSPPGCCRAGQKLTTLARVVSGFYRNLMGLSHFSPNLGSS